MLEFRTMKIIHPKRAAKVTNVDVLTIISPTFVETWWKIVDIPTHSRLCQGIFHSTYCQRLTCGKMLKTNFWQFSCEWECFEFCNAMFCMICFAWYVLHPMFLLKCFCWNVFLEMFFLKCFSWNVFLGMFSTGFIGLMLNYNIALNKNNLYIIGYFFLEHRSDDTEIIKKIFPTQWSQCTNTIGEKLVHMLE